jgi:CheY-like chemotaxis protein
MEDVWIADDEQMLRKLIVTVVQQTLKPQTMREFTDAESVVAALDKEVPKLLVTDNEMGRMQGIELIRYIRSLSDDRKNIRIIFCTSHDELADEAEKLGAMLLAKPVSLPVLKQALKEMYPG